MVRVTMTNKKLGESKIKILEICETPTSFTNVVRKVGISKTNVAIHLNDLEEMGLITKTEDGRYTITDKGREVLQKLKALKEFEKLYDEDKERALKLLKQARA